MRTRVFSLSMILLAALPSTTSAQAAQGGESIRLPFPSSRQTSDNLELTGFSRDGAALGASAFSVRSLAPGITEISGPPGVLANWEFRILDCSPVFGFGERFNALNQHSNILVNASRDQYVTKGTASYKPMPFFMSLRGYGLWVDTYSEAVFDLCLTKREEIIVRLRDTRLRIAFFEGPRFPQILERFTGLVGRAKLPPFWAFAPWKSRNWHPNTAAVYEDIEKYRQLGLPASVLVIDSPWETNYNTFEVNRKQFTDPETMLQRIHELGFKLCLWLTPFINQETFRPVEPELVGKIPLTAASNFEEGQRNGYFVKNRDGSVYIGTWWKGRGALVDFTNPAARDWWKGQVRKAIRLGANAFKADDGEGNFVNDSAFASGEDAAVMRTRYSILYNQTLQELISADLHGDGVLLMRSGTVGTHNLPFFWAGDNEANFGAENGLPSVLLAGLNAGLSGIPLWTHDLGGYIKSERTPGDDILFIRWTEFAAFSPIMQLHSGINLGPWDYGQQALEIFRHYSRLHMSLFPYRYSAAQESARTGMPLMRALLLLHQEDPNAQRTTDEYEFGSDLLVAPLLNPGTQRSVYLPAGDWVDYWSGRRFVGQQTIVVDAPLDRIPLHVRAGAILSKIPEDVMTLVPWNGPGASPVPSLDDRRVYEFYPGAAETLVDFEGRRLELRTAGDEKTLKMNGPPARVTLVWRFELPTRVTLAGEPLSLQSAGDSASVTFSHSGKSVLAWR